jgi:hypothetical protein
MPRPRPPYLHRQITRHGKPVWYVRKAMGPRTRIRATYGTPEFEAEYRAAISGESPQAYRNTKAVAGSLAWLWERYHEVGAWTILSPATRKARENIMVRVLNASGTVPCGKIKSSDIATGRDSRSSTPAQARSFLDTMRGLFRWAIEAGHITTDPTVGVKNPGETAGEGFPIWTESDIDAYQERWPIGTKQRVWLDVLLYTGLRRGDAVNDCGSLFFEWCPGTESNCRHVDFQSTALPTELPGHTRERFIRGRPRPCPARGQKP